MTLSSTKLFKSMLILDKIIELFETLPPSVYQALVHRKDRRQINRSMGSLNDALQTRIEHQFTLHNGDEKFYPEKKSVEPKRSVRGWLTERRYQDRIAFDTWARPAIRHVWINPNTIHERDETDVILIRNFFSISRSTVWRKRERSEACSSWRELRELSSLQKRIGSLE